MADPTSRLDSIVVMPEITCKPLLNVATPTNVDIPETSNSLTLANPPTRFVALSVEGTLAVTVTTPADISLTDKLVPKLIVPAVPTVLPSSVTTTPEPEPTTPVSPEPSPTNVALIPLGPLNDFALIIPLAASIVMAVPTFIELELIPVSEPSPITISFALTVPTTLRVTLLSL